MTASGYNSRDHERWIHFLHELIDVYGVSSGSPRDIFCATPFSGFATRYPTGIPTKEETTQAGGPVCKAGSVFSATPNIDV